MIGNDVLKKSNYVGQERQCFYLCAHKVYINFLVESCKISASSKKIKYIDLTCFFLSSSGNEHYLWVDEGWRVIVVMISGTNSTTSGWTFCLYIWYISTTIMGSSCRTFNELTPFGIKLCWKYNRHN
jgi:hypothetical protein